MLVLMQEKGGGGYSRDPPTQPDLGGNPGTRKYLNPCPNAKGEQRFLLARLELVQVLQNHPPTGGAVFQYSTHYPTPPGEAHNGVPEKAARVSSSPPPNPPSPATCHSLPIPSRAPSAEQLHRVEGWSLLPGTHQRGTQRRHPRPCAYPPVHVSIGQKGGVPAPVHISTGERWSGCRGRGGRGARGGGFVWGGGGPPPPVVLSL